jgi:hypothetical protein
MQDLEERRQLLAKVDAVWQDVIESEKMKLKRKTVDRDEFLSSMKSHQDKTKRI